MGKNVIFGRKTEMVEIKVMGYRCERCQHTWVPRVEGEEPRVCPKCKSPYWNRPRQKKSKHRKKHGGQ